MSIPALKKIYQEKVVPELKKNLGIDNPHLVPNLEKIVVSSGIRSEGMIVSAYLICSLLAGVGGLMLTAYIGTASTGVGNDYTLDTIASSVIGGTAFSGGIGTLEGTFPGVLIMTMLQSLMTILGISTAGKFLTQGIVIAVMVAINQMRQGNRN